VAKKLGKGLGRGLDAIFATENVELVIDNDKIWKITKDTNIYEILTFTLTNRKDGKTPTLETSTLSSISDDVRFNKTLTV